MSYDVYCIKNRAEKFVDFEHPTCKGRISLAGLAPQFDLRYEPLTGRMLKIQIIQGL